MKRNIVTIDESKCNGCGECVTACAEGAIQLIDGKAKLVSDVSCDGLGACLGRCPQGAISIETREAADFDEAAVKRHLASKPAAGHRSPPSPPQVCACPGSAVRQMHPRAPAATASAPQESSLGNWPVQLRLVPPRAPFLQGADLLICADCVPFAVADFHRRFLAGKGVLVGCPKLDDIDFYAEKIQEILRQAEPKSLTVLRMEVPCCAALAQIALAARQAADPHLPAEVIVVGIDGTAQKQPPAK